MNIVYCIEGTFNSGGMEKVITTKANYLSNIGYSITIITTEQKGREPFFPINKEITTIDLGINYLDYSNKNIFQKCISYLKKRNQHKRKLTKVLQSINADIVISTFGHEATFLYKIKDGSKKIAEFHFTKKFKLAYNRKGLTKYADLFQTKLFGYVASKYHKFIVLTNEDRELWESKKNIIVIPNFITNIPHNIATCKNKQCIAIGRLDYQKGFDLLIEAWSIIHKQAPDWTLNIFGDGNKKDELTQLINKKNLQNVIKLKHASKDIDKEFLKSSIFLFSSRFEGFGMALLEALSYGLPAVSFACKCGPKDLIQNNENGFLIKEGDIVEFANQILQLINDESKRIQMGKNAHLSSYKYSVGPIMNQWINLFSSIVKH